MSDHTDTTLTDTERDSLTECECGHYLNEHSSDGCLANDDDGDLCVCMATPDLIRERAITAIVAARVAAARADERARLVTWVESAQALSVATAEDYRGCCRSCDESYAPGIRHGGRVVADRLRALIEGADQ